MRIAGDSLDLNPSDMGYTADRMAGVVHTIAPEVVNHIANTCILGPEYITSDVSSTARGQS